MLRPPTSQTAASLFAHYELDSAFDEMFAPGHSPRDGYRLLFDRLLELPAAEWRQRQQAADVAFRNQGITFTVYERRRRRREDLPLRPRPAHRPRRRVGRRSSAAWCSASPRSTSSATTSTTSSGSSRKGSSRRELIYGASMFRREMFGVRRAARHLHPHLRHRPDPRPDGTLRGPRGQRAARRAACRYVLENRAVMKRVFPALFARVPRAGDRGLPVQPAPATLRVRRAAARDDPTVVVLTPGIYNSAYFEHSFLARQMGVELVEGRDLVVDDNVVYMRTTRGPAARRRDLPPRRRRLPRPARLPPRQHARRRRADERLPRRQRRARQRRRHRRRRRQGDLPLRAGDDPVLPRRGPDPAQRRDLPAAATPTHRQLRRSRTSTSWSSRRSTSPAATAC